jgi:small subunit ribosomal protein S5
MVKDQVAQKETGESTYQPDAVPEMEDRVISIDRISRTVKGGRRIRFRALIVTGNRNGRVGIGVSKASDVQGAIAKAKNKALKTMIDVPVVKGSIPHETSRIFGSTKVILKPAPEGHSIIAGGAVRSVVELAGIKNIVSKSIGSSNAINNATATFLALKELDANPVYRGKKQ